MRPPPGGQRNQPPEGRAPTFPQRPHDARPGVLRRVRQRTGGGGRQRHPSRPRLVRGHSCSECALPSRLLVLAKIQAALLADRCLSKCTETCCARPQRSEHYEPEFFFWGVKPAENLVVNWGLHNEATPVLHPPRLRRAVLASAVAFHRRTPLTSASVCSSRLPAHLQLYKVWMAPLIRSLAAFADVPGRAAVFRETTAQHFEDTGAFASTEQAGFFCGRCAFAVSDHTGQRGGWSAGALRIACRC